MYSEVHSFSLQENKTFLDQKNNQFADKNLKIKDCQNQTDQVITMPNYKRQNISKFKNNQQSLISQLVKFLLTFVVVYTVLLNLNNNYLKDQYGQQYERVYKREDKIQAKTSKFIQNQSIKAQSNQNSQAQTQRIQPQSTKKLTNLSKNYKIRQKFRQYTPKANPQFDLYQFTSSIDDIIKNSPIKKLIHLTGDQTQLENFDNQKIQNAIRLMEVTHNVNVKGEFQFDHFRFYKSPDQKYTHLSKLLKQQYDYYNQKYQISKYNKNQIRLCLCILTYNNAQKTRLYLRNLDSIFQQQYDNYHLVITNDASKDGTGEYIEKYMKFNNISREKYTLINNQENRGGLKNVYATAHRHCELGEVMVFVDGDDALIGRQVFSLLNAIYQKQKCVVTYGQFLITTQNQIMYAFTPPISQQNLSIGTNRRPKKFFNPHLKTMYVDIFRKIPITHFQYDNGIWIKDLDDASMLIPAFQLAGQRIYHVQQIIYEYRYDPEVSQDWTLEAQIEKYIYQRPLLQILKDFSFADHPKTKAYP